MNATIKRILIGAAGVAVSLSLLTMTPPTVASATDAHAVATATSHGDILVSTDFESVTAQTTNAQGQYIGAWFNSNAKHWSPSKAKKVKFVSSFAKGAASCKPFRLKKGKWYPHTLKLIDGTPVEVAGGSHVKYAWSLFDFANGDCTTPRHRGYYSSSKHKWYGDCVNPKPGVGWKVVDSVVEVKQHTATTWYLKTTWNAKAQVFGSVAVDCGTASSKASFTATGEATGSLDVSVTALTEAEARAKGKTQVETSVKSNTSVEGKIMVSGEANAEGNAEASCTNTTPPTPTGEIGSLQNINDVTWGNVITIRVTGTVPDGETATLKSSADIGTIADSDASISVTGNFDVKLHYTAPTEGSSDTVTVKLYSAKGVKWDEKSDSFALGRPTTP